MDYFLHKVFWILVLVAGGLTFWILKGFRSKLNDELKDRFFFRNLLAGLLICLVLIFYIGKKQKHVPVQVEGRLVGNSIVIINANGDTVRIDSLIKK